MGDRIKQIEARIAAATPGPWERDENSIESARGGAIAYVAEHTSIRTVAACGEAYKSSDADLIRIDRLSSHSHPSGSSGSSSLAPHAYSRHRASSRRRAGSTALPALRWPGMHVGGLHRPHRGPRTHGRARLDVLDNLQPCREGRDRWLTRR